MPLNFVCPNCQTGMTVPDRFVGKKVRCPKCFTKSIAGQAAGVRINKQAVVLFGLLLAIIVFAVVMGWLNG